MTWYRAASNRDLHCSGDVGKATTSLQKYNLQSDYSNISISIRSHLIHLRNNSEIIQKPIKSVPDKLEIRIAKWFALLKALPSPTCSTLLIWTDSEMHFVICRNAMRLKFAPYLKPPKQQQLAAQTPWTQIKTTASAMPMPRWSITYKKQGSGNHSTIVEKPQMNI